MLSAMLETHVLAKHLDCWHIVSHLIALVRTDASPAELMARLYMCVLPFVLTAPGHSKLTHLVAFRIEPLNIELAQAAADH